MTPAAFRKLALSLPNAVEQMHMGHPDFSGKGKLFATLDYPAPGYAAVMLSPNRAHKPRAQLPRNVAECHFGDVWLLLWAELGHRSQRDNTRPTSFPGN